ncbi:MAG: acyl-CoA dehydrogenase, partial [Alphaproteobacteria bacterium]|nr:acyl-CoA dehydrogenase [Alphaproteobacteria bacterium]
MTDTGDPMRDEMRTQVAALCKRFPGEYWREKDRDRAYPLEF